MIFRIWKHLKLKVPKLDHAYESRLLEIQFSIFSDIIWRTLRLPIENIVEPQLMPLYLKWSMEKVGNTLNWICDAIDAL